jgi:hypothetical protein
MEALDGLLERLYVLGRCGRKHQFQERVYTGDRWSWKRFNYDGLFPEELRDHALKLGTTLEAAVPLLDPRSASEVEGRQ